MLIRYVIKQHKTHVMKLFVVGIGISFSFFSYSLTYEKQLSKKEYVDIWRSTAVEQMITNKIPASITLAQGILESASGNSILATKGNNHFGIKCHDWTGETMFMDDDEKGECFRVYKNAEDSYIDHSTFLTSKKRYSALFTFEINDYKSWAKGLSEAGYATNPQYPELLVQIIEDLKLYELDVLGTPNNEIAPELTASSTEMSISKHTVINHDNKVKYIVARKGDTYYRIAKEFGLGLWQLYKYNDFGPQKDVLIEGDIIYIQPKRTRSKEDNVKLTKSMSLREISQIHAVKLESLIKLNDNISADKVIDKGEKITLR